MTLIVLLIALVLDFFLEGMEKLRNKKWWIQFYYFLENKIGHHAFWSGPLGVLAVLFLPMLLVILLQVYFDYWSWLIEAIFSLLILVYCLAPKKLDERLEQYITAIETENTEDKSKLESELIYEELATGENIELDVIKSTYIEAQQRIFSVIFWFLLLGAPGAILYKLVSILSRELTGIRSGLVDSLFDLLHILEWPVSRLMVLGMALAGHLMDALNAWRSAEAMSLDVNNKVLINGGQGALQYEEGEDASEDKAYWIKELKSLINRTLIIWLVVVAMMTLSGNLG